MNQSFHTGFQFDKGTVICQADNAASNFSTSRVIFRNGFPGILSLLLQSQGNFLLIRVVLQNQYFNFVPDAEHLRGVNDTSPSHIRDVQQSVYSTQVHEDTVVGNVFDNTKNICTFMQNFESLLTLFFSINFQQCSSGKDNVSTLLVELENFEVEGFPKKLVQVANWTKIHL